MSQEGSLFGIHLTKRTVSVKGEKELYQEKLIQEGALSPQMDLEEIGNYTGAGLVILKKSGERILGREGQGFKKKLQRLIKQ